MSACKPHGELVCGRCGLDQFRATGRPTPKTFDDVRVEVGMTFWWIRTEMGGGKRVLSSKVDRFYQHGFMALAPDFKGLSEKEVWFLPKEVYSTRLAALRVALGQVEDEAERLRQEISKTPPETP